MMFRASDNLTGWSIMDCQIIFVNLLD